MEGLADAAGINLRFEAGDYDGVVAFMEEYGSIRPQLQADLDLAPTRLVKQVYDEGVVKFVSRLADGLDIESVVIPMHRRNTLCVSSQVGCRMGCRFCRTGKMGLLRKLTAAEMADVEAYVRKLAQYRAEQGE